MISGIILMALGSLWERVSKKKNQSFQHGKIDSGTKNTLDLMQEMANQQAKDFFGSSPKRSTTTTHITIIRTETHY